MTELGIRLPQLHPGQLRRRKLIAETNSRFVVTMCGRRWGKALALDTPIPTPFGWTTMGQVQVGDTLYDENGQECRVEATTEVMYGHNCHRVVFSDGAEIVADADHRWLTWDRRARKNTARNRSAWPPERVRRKRKPLTATSPAIRTTRQIADTILDGKDNNHSIPCTAPVVGRTVAWPIAPYALGAWLGDGLTIGSRLFSADLEVPQRIADEGEIVRKLPEPYAWAIGQPKHEKLTGVPFTTRLRGLGVLGNKHIPSQYLRAPAHQRIALLQGLMDTDGCVGKNGHCEFTSVKERLAYDTLELILSLGIRATISIGKATLRGRVVSDKYRIHFTTRLPVFHLHRKAERLRVSRLKEYRGTEHRFIVSADEVPSVPVRCIRVNSPSHLFLCSRAFIPTHNSVDGTEWLMEGAMQGEPCALFAPTYKYLLEPWLDMTNRMRPITEASGGKINEQERTIRLPNGGLIDCWTMDSPDPGRGRKYKRAVVDEAGIVRNLKATFEQSIRPTLVDLAGHAWLYGTPKGRTHDFSVLFDKGEKREDGWLSFRAPTADNFCIPAEEIELARKSMSEQAFAQEFEGIPADDGGNPFGLTAIAKCVAPKSSKPPVVWGWDFARAQDWTVGVALDEDGAVCRFERWQMKPWGETVRLVVMHTGPVTIAYGDSTGLGDVVVEQIQNQRVRMAGVHFSRPEKQQLMERLASAIQRGTITFPDGPIKQELDTFQYEYSAFGVRYCVAPDTKILTSDLRWVRAGTLRAGDKLLGFDEFAPANKRSRQWKESEVESIGSVIRPSSRITLSDGTVITASNDHRWLVDIGAGGLVWRKTNELRGLHPTSRSKRFAPTRIVRYLYPWKEQTDYTAGYLAATFDGEGHLSQAPRSNREGQSVFRIGFAQRENVMAAQVRDYLVEAGFEWGECLANGNSAISFGIVGGFAETACFLGSIRPKRLLAKFDPNKLGTARTISTPYVVSIEPVGEIPVIAMQTTTRTFLAEGLASHNCAPDGLHDDCVMALALALKGLPPKREVRAVIDRTKQQDRAPHYDFAKRRFDVITPRQAIDEAFSAGKSGRIGLHRIPRITSGAR